MYDFEIDAIIRRYNYNIPKDEYFKICDTSSQINVVKYDPWSDSIEINTKDGGYWKFKVVC